MTELTDNSEPLRLVHDQDTIAACRADLARLLPRWLSLAPEERQWQLQRFLDRLTAQPTLIPAFRAVLQQEISQEAAETGSELLKELKQSLDLL